MVGLVVLLFDTAIFSVCRVVSEHYHHARPLLLHRITRLSSATALKVEEEGIKGFLGNLARNVRTVAQILIAKTAFQPFFPYWTEWSKACEEAYQGSETVAQYGATLVCYVFFPACFHILMHTFCYGKNFAAAAAAAAAAALIPVSPHVCVTRLLLSIHSKNIKRCASQALGRRTLIPNTKS